MKRLALLCLAGCLVAGIIACTGTRSAAPSPAPAAKATVITGPGSAAVASPAAEPSGKTAAAVAASYYRTIVARNYRRAFTYLAARATGPDGRRLTLPSFLQLAHMLDNEGGPVTWFSVGAFPSQIVMTVERRRIWRYHAHLRTARDKDGWVIVSIDRI